MTTVFQDFRGALRMMGRNLGFTLVAVLVIAIGIGANTTMFSVAHSVLFQPMPYAEPDRLVALYESFPERGFNQLSVSYPTFVDWQEQAQSFEALAAQNSRSTLVLTGGEEPLRLNATFITPGYFQLLGVKAALGRTFLPEENVIPDGHPMVILSYGLWQRHFGGDPGVVGKSISLSEQAYTVVGVLEEGFHDLATQLRETDLWVPAMQLNAVIRPARIDERSSRVLYVVGRLKPGVTLEQARSEITSVAARVETDNPNTNKGYGATLISLKEDLLGDLRTPVQALLAGAFFVLLIGTLNVASLLLARAVERNKEMTLRLAIGAGRGHLLGQLLVEGLVLAFAGGALGVLMSLWGVHLLARFNPIVLPSYVEFGIDITVLGVAFGLALVTGLIFALAPAFQASRANLRDSLSRAGGRGGSAGGRGWARSVLVVIEVAAALILLVGAGLMIHSLYELRSTDVGFETDHLLTMQMDLLSRRYDEETAVRGFARDALAQVRSLPGVKTADIWGPSIPSAARWITTVVPEGKDATSIQDAVIVLRNHITAGALENLGIGILNGRDIGEQDTADNLKVAVVSQSAAEVLWPGEDPLGKRLRRWATGSGTGQEVDWFTVVGVAETVQHQSRLREDANDRAVYFAYDQMPRLEVNLLVRSQGDANALASPVRRTLAGVDPELPIYNVMTLEDLLHQQESSTQFTTLLLTLFALVAVFLAMLGVYSVLAFLVNQRTREVGIRMALGARPASILTLFSTEAGKLLGVGLALGLLGAFLTTRLMAAILYGVSTQDATTFVIASGALILAAILATWLPARRASRVDPLVALKAD